MKTYLKTVFNSSGQKPSAIHDALAGIGFSPMHGAHDFVYEWPSEASVEEILGFGDQVHEALHGTGVLFEMETV
ncbi:MAG: hypothetical protein ACPHK8_02645 [Thermoplasmatota archaeon]